MHDTSDVARRLWALCSVLRDEGVTYHEYLNELTQLLFLKLADELQVESRIPEEYRWAQLIQVSTDQGLNHYRELLSALGDSLDPVIRDIFQDSTTRIRTGDALVKLLNGIDSLDWYRAAQSGLGDVYEGLIDKSAQEVRYGAGQYFTPRPVVEALVATTAPGPNDNVYDPAAGTGGFLIAAGLYCKARNEGQQPNLSGVELVRDVQRMGLMNVLLHDLAADLKRGDALAVAESLPQYSVCLTNPPFGVKGSLTAQQAEQLDFPTNNKQLAFLQHVYKVLGPNGRAAIVVPDNVLFEAGTAAAIRERLLSKYRLHTVLHLPTGIFYATGIKTTVLFFAADGATTETWFYDLRNGNGTYGKKRSLADSDFEDFIQAYGGDPSGKSERSESARFRKLSLDQIAATNYRLDLAFKAPATSDSSSPLELVSQLLSDVKSAQISLENIDELLRPYLRPKNSSHLATSENEAK